MCLYSLGLGVVVLVMVVVGVVDVVVSDVVVVGSSVVVLLPSVVVYRSDGVGTFATGTAHGHTLLYAV